MRLRSLALIVAIFGVAALASWFVVRQLPREGQESAVAAGTVAPPAAVAATPALDRAATAADGEVVVRVTAGPEPRSGADVRLYLAMPAAAGEPGVLWRVAGAGRTGADGVARIAARPGRYLVVARVPTLAPGRAEAVRSAAEPSTAIDVSLEPAAVLEGRVTSREGGRPVAARIAATPLVGAGNGSEPPSAPAEERGTAAADASGAFRMEGLAPGLYALSAEAQGFHPVALPRVAVPRAAPLAIAVEPLGAASGIVRLQDGRPAAGARVLAVSPDHAAAATAGADGRFALAVPAGSYRLLATAADRAGVLVAPVPVVAGGSARGLELALVPGAVIDGTVTAGTAGAPLPGAEVALFPHEATEPLVRARTGADGRFTLSGIPAGSFDVRATARGRSPLLQAGVTVAAGQRFPLRLTLAGTGAIEGVVRDVDGKALAGALVRVDARGDGLVGAVPLETRSDFEGRFRIDGLEVGRAELVAHQEGVALGAARAVHVQEGRAARADFVVPEAGLLEGRVADDGKPPPRGTAVVAAPMRAGAGGPQVARAVADGTGYYRLALPAGEYRVHAAPAEALRTDLRVAPRFASVQPARTTRLDLSAAPAVAESGVEVRVLEPGGAPSPGALVRISRAGDERVALATSAGEDGTLVLGKDLGMSGQPVQVRARSGGRAGSWTGTLPAQGAVTVALAPGGAVEGAVRARAKPVSGFVLVVASAPTQQGGWRTVDVHRFSGDRFELADLPAAPVRLTVRTDDGREGSADVTLRPAELRRIEIPVSGRVATARPRELAGPPATTRPRPPRPRSGGARSSRSRPSARRGGTPRTGTRGSAPAATR